MENELKSYNISQNYNSIIFSVYKSLVIFNLLSSSPHTKNEIKEVLKTIPFFKTEITDDTLRVYINSLIASGCVIEKTLTRHKHREYTYYIKETPFKPVITDSLTDEMFDLYDICTYNMPFEKFLSIDLFYRKLATHLDNEYFLQKYKKHSKLDMFDTGLLRTLTECCINHSIVTVMYKSPHSGFKEMNIAAYEIGMKNYKLYLNGFGYEYGEVAPFLLERIQNIIKIRPNDGSDIKNSLPDMIYELYDFDEPIDENEEILQTTPEYRLIKRKVQNKLMTFQRILQFGSSCRIVEPELYKNEMIKTLNSMKEVYVES